MKESISQLMLSFLIQNNIHGCIILITEDGEDVITTHAADKILDMNVTKSLAQLIIELEEDVDDLESTVIRNCALSIIAASHIVQEKRETT